MNSVQRNAPLLEELVSVPIDLIAQDRTLEHPIYLNIAGRSVLFRPEGDVLTTRRARTLKERIDSVSIPRASLETLLNSARKEISREMDFETSQVESCLGRLRNLMVAQGHLLEGNRETQRMALAAIHDLCSKLSILLKKDPSMGHRFIHRFSEPSLYYVNHSVNVAIYSALIGIKMNLRLEALRALTYGAMVHNVGKIFLSREILFKKGPLNHGEWDHMKWHPILGARLLETFHVPHEVTLVALQHHERMDGQGYPNGLEAEQIHIFARICSIADVFAALTSDRSYRKALTANEAIKLMRAIRGKFDPQILKAID